MTPRQAALLSVNSCIGNGRYTNLELSSVIRKYKFEGLDKSFFTSLFYGTVERMLTLDYCIGFLSTVKIEKLDNMVLCLLRTGLYQILFMDRVPDSAAVNESVELAKRYCPKSAVGYVNAVLRAASGRKEALFSAMQAEKGLRRISVLCSIPEEILRCIADSYGTDAAVGAAEYFSSVKPHLTLRVNTAKTTRDALLAALGNAASPSALVPTAIRMNGSFPAEDLYGFDDGLFFVQDEASQLACAQIGRHTVPAGGVIVDTCACPGGKTFSVSLSTAGENAQRVRIYAFDLHENRLSLIEKGAARLGLANITTAARDAREPDPSLAGKANAVLCDVPCSGLGVLAKKPDIRYKPLAETARLPEIQKAILSASAGYLKHGGTLLYSTCTLNRAENEDVVAAFLAARPDFHLSDDPIVGDKKGMALLLPQTYGTDGFFIAKLIKD